jgi:hypothetical protein
MKQQVGDSMLRHAMVIACLLWVPWAAQAAQGAVEFTPLMEAGKPLTIEVRNLSKLPVNLKQATLEFAAPNAASGPCRLSLAAPVSLSPAEMKTVSLGESSAVTRCMPQPATGGPARAFVLKPRELTGAEAPARDLGNAVLHPADLSYSFEIGGRAVTDKATWLFAVE